jgi:O-antigen/teichoic acid export membrane protein
MNDSFQTANPSVMHSSRRTLARNTLYNLAGQGLPVVAAVISAPILVRNMGTDRFGLLNLAWIIIGYFSLFDLGLGRALTQVIAKKLGLGLDKEIDPVARVALFFILLLGIAGTLIAVLLAHPLVYNVLKVPAALQAETLLSFYLLAVSIPFVVSTAALRGILEAYLRFDLVNALRLPMGLFTYLGPLLVLPFSNGLPLVVVVLLVGRIVAWGAHIVFCLRVLPNLFASWSLKRSLLGPLLRFGGWMTVTNIVGPLMVVLDRFLIGALTSVAAVAYYATPYQAVSQIGIIPVALVGVLFPAFAAIGARSRTTALLNRSAKYIFLALFPIVVILVILAREILSLWLGVEFAQNSTVILQWLSVGVLINNLALVPFALIQGIGRPDLTAKLHMTELPLYLVALWFLTKAYGIEGAAVASVLRITVDAIVLFWIAAKHLPDGTVVIKRLAVSISVSILVLGVASLLQTIQGKIISASIILVTFAIVTWFRFLESDERTIARNLLNPSTLFR